MTSRNYNDPIYEKWRRDVKKRDGGVCQWPGCHIRYRLRAHHIKTWASYPSLRFEVSNGISLCKKHHDDIWGKEEDYERLFYTIIKQQELKNPKEHKKRSTHQGCASKKYYKQLEQMKKTKLKIKEELRKWQKEQKKSEQ